MRFDQPLLRARFVRREKRFIIHAVCDDGTPLVAHTNNTGRMTGCLSPAAPVWFSPAADPARKLKWTLEIVETQDGTSVGVNTALANALVAEAITGGLLPGLDGFPKLSREVRYGDRGSRADLLLEDGDRRVWVEVKNVSLVAGGHGRFPDAPTVRGRKHLSELATMVQRGDRAVLVFCSQRDDAITVGPADAIDPEYGQLLRRVHAGGVEVLGIGCQVTPTVIVPARALTVRLG